MTRSTSITIEKLCKAQAIDIAEMEGRAWIPGVRASVDRVKYRFDLGHHMMGAVDLEKGDLVGLIAFSYNVLDEDNFPRTFEEFSTLSYVEDFDCGFVYNLSIVPENRDWRTAVNLVKTSLGEMYEDGCKYSVGDARCSSYNGSLEYGQERVKQSLEFREAIDNYMQTGEFPTQRQLMNDPTLAFYKKVTGCDFFLILPDFIPEDEPSGGYRVIMRRDLEKYMRGEGE